jgi:hypothetical protein
MSSLAEVIESQRATVEVPNTPQIAKRASARALEQTESDERARFIRLALLEAYLDPVSGDPLAWQALISALEAEGLSYSVDELRPRPFAVEFGPRLTEALG